MKNVYLKSFFVVIVLIFSRCAVDQSSADPSSKEDARNADFLTYEYPPTINLSGTSIAVTRDVISISSDCSEISSQMYENGLFLFAPSRPQTFYLLSNQIYTLRH